MKTPLLMIAALLAVQLHAEPPLATEASIVTTNRTVEPAQIPPDKRILVRAQFGGVALKDIKSSTSFIEAELIQKVFEDGKSQTIEVIRELRYPTELEVTPMNGTAKLEVTPSNFATKNLGLTLTLTATREDQSIMFHGSCVIRRHVNWEIAKSPIEPGTPAASAFTIAARECDFAGMAPMGQMVMIDLGEKGVDSGNLMLSFFEDETPPAVEQPTIKILATYEDFDRSLFAGLKGGTDETLRDGARAPCTLHMTLKAGLIGTVEITDEVQVPSPRDGATETKCGVFLEVTPVMENGKIKITGKSTIRRKLEAGGKKPLDALSFTVKETYISGTVNDGEALTVKVGDGPKDKSRITLGVKIVKPEKLDAK